MRKETKDTADLDEPIEVDDDLEVPDADEADLEDLAGAGSNQLSGGVCPV